MAIYTHVILDLAFSFSILSARHIYLGLCSSSSFISLVKYSRLCMFTYPFSWWTRFLLFPFFSLLQIGYYENAWAYVQISLDAHLGVILASLTLLVIAKLYSHQLCLNVSMASHPCQALFVVLLDVFPVWWVWNVSYVKHLECCLA